MQTPNYLYHFKWLKTTFFLTIGFLCLFWIYFFGLQNGSEEVSDIYKAYERAFAIPDLLWICILLFLSFLWLKNNQTKGIVTTIAAGSALVFLALADISFNFQQGLYTVNLFEGLLNSVINMLSLGYGLTLLYVGQSLITLVSNK